LIESLREDFAITELCEIFEVSKSGYYKHFSRQPSQREKENEAILEKIQMIRAEPFKNNYGSPRMTEELRKHGFDCSENRVARIMAEAGIDASAKAAFRPKTTIPDSNASPSLNLIKDLVPRGPGEIVVSDITYIATKEGWLYLAVIIDLFTREVTGWSLADHMKTELLIDAAEKAATQTPITRQTVFHSDRGSQYSSNKMRKWLNARNARQSMSASGYCYDNAACESFFSILKRESFPDGCVFETKTDARRQVFKYIETFYNKERIHTALGNISPIQFAQKHLNKRNADLKSAA